MARVDVQAALLVFIIPFIFSFAEQKQRVPAKSPERKTGGTPYPDAPLRFQPETMSTNLELHRQGDVSRPRRTQHSAL